MSNSEPSRALKSKIIRLHTILKGVAVKGDDRNNLKQAIEFIHCGYRELEKDPSNAGAALHWCEQAEPYTVLKNKYRAVGFQESPNRTVERATVLLREILGKTPDQ